MEQNNLKVMAKVVNQKPTKNPEERIYLLCIAGKDGADDEWHLLVGRTQVYDMIKESIEFIDLERSFVLVETSPLSNRKSIYAFMKHVEQFYEDSFDIEDYIKGDWNEEDYRQINDIDSSLYVDDSDKLDMVDFMNGGVKMVSLVNQKEEE